MGNLGAYQWITTISKKVGGPYQLLALTAVGGYAVFRGVEAGGKKIYKIIKEHTETEKTIENAQEYTVTQDGISNEGVSFTKGEKFAVLEKDGKSVLIDKINDENSPYFVSEKFLTEISEYTSEA